MMAISIKKPKVKSDISAEDALKFATETPKSEASKSITRTKKVSQKAIQEADSKSGLVPEGDVRLTANMRGDLHMKLKMKAVQDRTTIGELLEALVDGYLDKV
jgi:hypothetical protein